MQAQPWVVALGCFTAGTLAAMGIANAVSAPTKIPDSTTGVITACMVKKTGDVRFINAQKGATCTKKEKKITFNQTGPQGPQGPAGAQGERGPSNGYVAQRTTAKAISEVTLIGGNNIATLTLPAGTYLLNANTTAKATDAVTDEISCRLSSPTGTTTGTPAEWTVTNQDDLQPFAVSGSYTNTVEASVSLTCWPADLAPGSFAGSGEVTGGTLTATRVAELTGP